LVTRADLTVAHMRKVLLAGRAICKRIRQWPTYLEGWNRSMTPDYYTLLGVAPGAEDELIRAAYLALAKRYHPDTAAAASPHNVEQFRLIAEAYEVLRDPRRRAYYDWCHARQEQNSAQQIQGERSQEEQEHGEVRAPAKSTWLSAIDNPLVYSAGTVALVVAVLFGLIKVIALNVPSANTDVAMGTEKFEGSSSFLSDKAPLQELTDLRRTLQQTKRLAAANQESLAQERVRSQDLEKQLAARGDSDKLLARERARIEDLEKQLAARGDSDKLLAQERSRIQELEKQLAARGDSDKLLVQERARGQELEKQQLAARSDSDKLLARERARS
jgi:curved DNA-binding protein CbpA